VKKSQEKSIEELRVIIETSNLFDKKFYLMNNRGVRTSDMTCIEHYIKHGIKEDRKPNKDFDPVWYREFYAEVKEDGGYPLLHYILFGQNENRYINEQEKDEYEKLKSDGFDVEFYKNSYEDLKAQDDDFDFILHYIRNGKNENRTLKLISKKSKSIVKVENPKETIEKPSEELSITLDETIKYTEDEKIILESGLFDGNYYLNTYEDIKKNNKNPLKHFCEYGWKEDRNPNPEFNTKYYKQKYPDIEKGGINPFLHWIMFGKGEGRLINQIEVEVKSKQKINTPSIIFITHEASQTGAPAVIISLMKWLKGNTDINFSIVIGASGIWNNRFEELAPCFYMDGYHKDWRKELRNFCGSNVKSVYINTIASGLYAEHLKFLNAEFITHVHEMENLFKVFEPHFEIIKRICNKFIAVSQGSLEAIEKRTKDQDIDLFFLKPFIDVKVQKDMKIEKPTNKKVIFGCGAVETRKGFDLFCDVGARLLTSGFTNFKMLWIGSAQNKDIDPQVEISKRALEEYVEWIGTKDYPRDYFEFGDLFLLTSREDPYPLVCMEAAECFMPVLCFDEQAGGMHSFVEEDAGIVIPYLDIEKMAQSSIELLTNDEKRKTLGVRAHEKVKERHYVDVIAPKILKSLPKIENSSALSELEAYKESIDNHEIISFDIFDTLITRRVSNPNIVFDIIEYEHTQNQSAVMPLFQERMQTAGKVLGSHQGKKDDISIDEIYENMSFYKNSQIEKDTEIKMCTAHPLGLELYNYALSQNKKIFITSDMYLDKDTIQKMLKKCEISKWDKFLLSSEQGKKKDTGKLYELMITISQELNVSKNQILHIGDNWVGDVDKAKQSGINALRFNPLYEEEHKLFNISKEKENELSQIGKIWNSYCTQATNLWSEKNISLSSDFYTKLGFELAGPLSAMMAMYVKSKAEKTESKKIVFMARDGRIIKKAFDKLYKTELEDNQFESLYLSLSRSTVIPATFEEELSSNDIYFLIEGLHLNQKEIRYFLNKSNVDLEDKKVNKIVKKYFKSIDIIPTWNDLNTLSNMFQDLSKTIYQANEKNRKALKLYLEKFDLLTQKNVIVVDVGWLLNIQSRLDNFIKKYSDTKITGCYIGSRDRINKSLHHSSLLFDAGDPFVYSKFFEDNTTLCEVLFSAPEASAKALVLDQNDEVKVEFKKLDSPLSSEFKIAQKIQMGAEDFFDYFAKAKKDFFPEQISKDYFFYIFQALANTDLDIAKATLGNFEVKLGGHHEFLAYEALVKCDAGFEYKVKENDEYFRPIHYKAQNPIKKNIIITSAGLNNGSTRYRALNLAKSFQAQNITSIVIHSVTDINTFKLLLENTSEVIFQRCFDDQGNVKEFYNLIDELDITKIYEIDDLIFPEHIANVGSVKGGEWNINEATYVAESYEKFLLKCDKAIVSTPLLQEYIQSKYSIQTQIVRNKVNITELINPKQKVFDKLKLIYASGTYSHKKDFEIIEELLYDFLVKNKDKVSLSILGAAQVSEKLLSLENVSNYPLLEYNAMLEFISKHDLMLVPLEDDIFNKAKSNVKFVECGAVSVPVLASNIDEFKLFIEDGENGFLALNKEEWIDKLNYIVKNPTILNEIAQNANNTIKANFLTQSIEEEIIKMIKG